jgi:hypothetical protein
VLLLLHGRGGCCVGVGMIGVGSQRGWIVRIVPPVGTSFFDSRDRKRWA